VAGLDPIHQFVVLDIIPIKMGGIDVSFTNSSLWMVIGAITSITFLTLAMRKQALIPGRMQMAVEILYDFVSKMINDNIGHNGRIYFPLIFTVFMFVLMGNVLGLIPHSFTYTSQLIVTVTLALIVFISVIVFGIINNGIGFLSLFMPPNAPLWLLPFIVPIEVVSFFVRPITLSVRLFANMMAGHIVLKVVASFGVAAASMGAAGALLGSGPVAVNTIMLVFELLVAVIQAYVFAILSCVYLKDSLDVHH